MSCNSLRPLPLNVGRSLYIEHSTLDNEHNSLVSGVEEEEEESGKRLSALYDHEGNNHGTQTIERMSTIPEMVKILEVRREYLAKINKGKGSHRASIEAEMEEIAGLLESCHDALNGLAHIPEEAQLKIDELEQTIQENSATNQRLGLEALKVAIKARQNEIDHYREQCRFDWIGSNYVRDCLVENIKMAGADLQAAYAAYKDTCRQIIPAAVNMRRHEIEAQGKKITILRTGVISDMRDGYHSLDMLLKMRDNKFPHLRAEHYEMLQAKLTALQYKHKGSTPEMVVLMHACENIKTPEALDNAIAQRRHYLQHQMLMLILEHAKTAQLNGSLIGLQTLPIMHLSLLNRKTDVVDPTGWKKNEEIFMCDMAQIFKEFDNRQVVFDGHGPLIDNDGVIHLPAEFGVSRKKMTLETYFMNISVQNNKKNDGKQAEINRCFFRKFENEECKLDKELKALRKRLKESSDFEAAEACALFALKQGLYLSIGCLSAKDRTGWLCGRIGVLHALEHMPAETRAKTKLVCEAAWSCQILEGPALGVCLDCNLRALEPLNVVALKLTEFNLGGVGIAKRMDQYSKLFSMAVKPKDVKRVPRKIAPPQKKRRGIKIRRWTPLDGVKGKFTSIPLKGEAIKSGEPAKVKRRSLAGRIVRLVLKVFGVFALLRLCSAIRRRLGRKKVIIAKAA